MGKKMYYFFEFFSLLYLSHLKYFYSYCIPLIDAHIVLKFCLYIQMRIIFPFSNCNGQKRTEGIYHMYLMILKMILDCGQQGEPIILISSPTCSEVGQRYPPDKSLSNGSVLGKPIVLYVLDSGLSSGQSYPPFEQLVSIMHALHVCTDKLYLEFHL